VHSDFLQIAVNLGILPALIFIAGYLVTLQRLFVKTRNSVDLPVQGDLALGLLLAFLAAGEHLAVQGIEVLPQLALPVWFVWALVEVWLRQRSTASDFAYAYAPANFYPVTNVQ
jgi:O-antigen ligase